MRVDLTLEVDVERTPRVVQLEGIFDLPDKKRTAVDFHFDVPLEEKPWQIGLIVGPSGAGKSSVARHLFAEQLVSGYDWHPSRSVVDSFGDLPVRDVTAALSSVGFSSPPSWVKPFRVLSNGEQFRATMARAIMDARKLVVIDEFTSVVDRTVARIGAGAIAKTVRRTPGKQFVAVTCHDDVEAWLQPDWKLEPHVGLFTWRSLQRRPSVEIKIHRALPDSWQFFSKHHYLAANMHRNSRCFVATIDGEPAGFIAILPFPHPRAKNMRRVHRVVVLPDYQGLGLALKFMEVVGALARTLGYRMLTHPAHPALVKAKAQSKNWLMNSAPGFKPPHGDAAMRATSSTWYRRTASFEYCGAPWADEAEARAVWGSDTLNRGTA
jgi:ABC-type molybdenum transport system ATPase subunit/photorepair protein PhrA/GNAT superfamily N-acetyltransferase